MGHRLSKIYTRTGDAGRTGLADGSRVEKDAPRIEAIGAVDELNCALGALLLHGLPGAALAPLRRAQHRLFDLGGELAMPGTDLLGAEEVEHLETALDALNAQLPPLKEFILPGGGGGACAAHAARAVCRRAERRLVALARGEAVNPVSRRYLNRLSDLLFVVARVEARAGGGEVCWEPAARPERSR